MLLVAAAALGLAAALPGSTEAGGYRHDGDGYGGWSGRHHGRWRPHPHWRPHHGHYATPPVYYRPRPYAYGRAPSIYFGFRAY